MISVYFVSIVILFLMLQYKGLKINHPYYFFVFFSVLYTVFPYYHSTLLLFDIFPAELSLTFSTHVIEERVFISIISVLSFIVLIIFSGVKKSVFIGVKEETLDHQQNLLSRNEIVSGKLSFYLFLFVYPAAVYCSYNYAWQDVHTTGLGFGHTVAAHMKDLLLVIFVYSIYKIPKKKIFSMLFLFMILTIIDTQRTTFFIMILAVIFSYSWSRVTMLTIFSTMFLMLMFVAVNRLGIDFSPKIFLFPFVAESVFGSYSLSQAVEIVGSGYGDFYFHAKLFFSTFIEIISKFVNPVFTILGTENSLYYTFESDVNSAYREGVISEKYAPMGGTFYLADYHLMFPYVGVIFSSMIYFYFVRFSCRISSKNLSLLLYSLSPIIMKTSPFVFIKLLIVLYLYYLALLFFISFFKLVLRHGESRSRSVNLI